MDEDEDVSYFIDLQSPSLGGELHRKGWTGIDTIAVWSKVAPGQSLPHKDARVEAEYVVDTTTGEIRYVHSHSILELAHGVRARVYERYGEMVVDWEHSVPRFLHGHNVHPASLDEVKEVVTALHGEVSDIVELADPPEEMHVRRLDLDRDFQAPGVAQHFEQLRYVQPAIGKKHRAMTGSDGRFTGLTSWTKNSWHTSIYDKYNELCEQGVDDLYALGNGVDRVRFELSLKGGALRGADMNRVEQLNEANIDAQRRKYFSKLKLDSVLAGAVQRLDAIRAAQRDLGNQTEAVIGDLWLRGHGLSPSTSRNTRAKRARQAAASGLGVEMFTETLPVSRRSWFDYDKGELVVED